MGGSQSRTRKLTVENDDPASIIKVSDDVVQRIKNSQEKKTTNQADVVFSKAHTPPPSNVAVPAPLYYEPAAVSPTTIQLRQANLEDLKKNDVYWQRRLTTMIENHKKINEIFETEFQRALSERTCKKTDSKVIKQPPCLDYKEEVKKCYQQHPDQPMKCAKVVQAFQQCVDKERSTLISSRG